MCFKWLPILHKLFIRKVLGREGVVGIAACYGFNRPGIEFRLGRFFPLHFRLALGPTQPFIQYTYGLFCGGNAAGVWR
jgi:hypothetical protein